tara:strand:+ start:928 stop:1035 length:108 start_codon:yes stop_codon:yes gene_type:complete
MGSSTKTILVTLGIVMVGLAVHQAFIAPMIAKRIK